MLVTFTTSPYLQTVKQHSPHFANENRIHQYVHANQQYRYPTITFPLFNQNYSAKGWLKRELLAIPAAMYAGTIKVLYHLFLALFSHRKANLYSIGRDWQETAGYLVTVFHDKFGSYVVQESIFHKECYRAFSRPYTGFLNSQTIQKIQQEIAGFLSTASAKYNINSAEIESLTIEISRFSAGQGKARGEKTKKKNVKNLQTVDIKFVTKLLNQVNIDFTISPSQIVSIKFSIHTKNIDVDFCHFKYFTRWVHVQNNMIISQTDSVGSSSIRR